MLDVLLGMGEGGGPGTGCTLIMWAWDYSFFFHFNAEFGTKLGANSCLTELPRGLFETVHNLQQLPESKGQGNGTPLRPRPTHFKVFSREMHTALPRVG